MSNVYKSAERRVVELGTDASVVEREYGLKFTGHSTEDVKDVFGQFLAGLEISCAVCPNNAACMGYVYLSDPDTQTLEKFHGNDLHNTVGKYFINVY